MLIYISTPLAPYLFIICLDYVLRTSIDKIKENGFELTKKRSRRYPATTITDADYADDIAILAKSWQQDSTRHQLYGHLPPITKTIQVRRTRHAGHCWRNRDELIRDVLLWILTHGRAKTGRPARTYIQQLCEDTGCCPEDLPRGMNDREEWRERVRDIRATSAIWWWWWWFVSLWYFSVFTEILRLIQVSNRALI